MLAENEQRAAAPDQNAATLKLKQGKNHLLLKICKGNGDWAFYFRRRRTATSRPRGWFEDVSGTVGLGPTASAADLKGDTLTVATSTATAGPTSSTAPAPACSF